MLEGPFFDSLPEATRRDLDARAKQRVFAPGESLFRQGDTPRELFLLLSGRVKVWRGTEAGGGLTLALIGRGAPLGTFGAGGERPLSSTATALTDVVTAAWSIEDVDRMLATDAVFATAILRAVAGHATQVIERLEELSAVPVEQRLARTLLRVAAALDGDGGSADLLLSRQDLADLIFSTLPTVSRIMSRWRAAGLVDGGRGRVRLTDRVGLARVAVERPAGDGDA